MAVIDLDALLAPVSADAPCGPDLEYKPPLLALQALARGKEEQYIADRFIAAEEPAWPEVRESAEALFASTKDLRVAGILHLALLKTAGIAGLEAGLCLQRRMLEQYWEHLHPQLDAEEDNDPIMRVNSLLEALVSEAARAELRVTPLVESRRLGKFSLRNYRIAMGTLKASGADGEAIDPQQELTRIEAAFADAPLEAMSETATLLGAAAEHLKAIEHILLDKADGIPDDLKGLAADLREMKSVVDAQLAKRAPEMPVVKDDVEVMSANQHDSGAASSGVAPAGTIRNRSDVLQMIDKICEYYARTEPSSPVPLLLQRAKRLVNKDFMEILRDMTPSGVSEAELIGGLEKGDN